MDILLYLTALLQTRKTIGIVGLGTLYKKKSPGKYDVDKHAFIPPSYTIAFTVDVKEQEELANYISSKRNITTDSANYYIGEFADRIQNQLSESQEADLESIGKLKFVNDEVILVTDQENTFGFEFYGLPTLGEIKPANEKSLESNADEVVIPETVEQEYIEELEEESKVDEVTVPETVKEEYLENVEEENKLEEENPGQETTNEQEENALTNDEQETFEEIAEVENVKPNIFANTFIEPPAIETVENEEEETKEVVENKIIAEEFVEEPKKGTPILIKALFVLLFLIAACAIAYFINPQFYNKYFKNENVKPAKVITIAPVDSLSSKADSLLADSLSRNNAMVNLAPDTPAVDSSKITIYEVIGTAESTKASADAYIARVAKKGIKAKPIRLSKQLINISLGTFIDQKEALKYQDSLRIVLKNPGIWVKSYKPKTHKN